MSCYILFVELLVFVGLTALLGWYGIGLGVALNLVFLVGMVSWIRKLNASS